MGFVVELAEKLALMLAPELAPAAALAVLSSPTVAVRRSLLNGEHCVLQSVVLDGSKDEFATQVTIRIRTFPGRPPVASLETVSAAPVDLDFEDDRLRLVADVESWYIEFPMPHVNVPEPLPLRKWAWLGEPGHVGVLDVPKNWQDLVATTGAVYAVKPLIADSVDKLRAWKIEDRVDHVVVVRGTKWAENFPPPAIGRDIEITRVGGGGESFAAVLKALRARLLKEASEAMASTPLSRNLRIGEVVYHRKVGNSVKFDHFDQGSSEPCMHGASAFVSWGGDKAVKGMSRRYLNFSPAMLIHCSKYPNCGMYGVDANRGGLGACG